MWVGKRDANNEIALRNPNLMRSEGRPYFGLAAGHPEGWNDAMKNNLLAFYNFILDGKKLASSKPDFATFEDAHHIMKLTEAILLSAKEKRWVKVS